GRAQIASKNSPGASEHAAISDPACAHPWGTACAPKHIVQGRLIAFKVRPSADQISLGRVNRGGWVHCGRKCAGRLLPHRSSKMDEVAVADAFRARAHVDASQIVADEVDGRRCARDLAAPAVLEFVEKTEIAVAASH